MWPRTHSSRGTCVATRHDALTIDDSAVWHTRGGESGSCQGSLRTCCRARTVHVRTGRCAGTAPRAQGARHGRRARRDGAGAPAVAPAGAARARHGPAGHAGWGRGPGGGAGPGGASFRGAGTGRPCRAPLGGARGEPRPCRSAPTDRAAVCTDPRCPASGPGQGVSAGALPQPCGLPPPPPPPPLSPPHARHRAH